MDLDGTLVNGDANIPGVADTVYRLFTDDTKKVLFYSNGGYCSLEHTWQKVVTWLRDNLDAERFAVVEPLLTKNKVYNTA